MQSRYKNYQQIYTDGSKENSKVGCAIISDNHWKNGKLHGITALEINFLTSNQLLVNINQLFETLEKK